MKVNNLYLNDAEFRTAIMQRLGIHVFHDSPNCPNCDKKLDQYGYHALTCKRSGEKVRRHNSVRDNIFNQARNSHLNPVLEKANLIIDSNERPADVCIPKPGTNEDIWIDVAVIDSRQPTYLKHSLSNKNYAIEAYTKKKHEKYDHHVQKWNNDQNNRKAIFTPVVADSFGAWSQDSMDVFDFILKRDPERNEVPYSIRRNLFFSKLSMSIQRSNARSILNKQQQLKEFNFSYRNDNYIFNNLIKNSPIKSNIKKLAPKSDCFNLAKKVRNILMKDPSSLKIIPRRNIINPNDSFIEQFIKK